MSNGHPTSEDLNLFLSRPMNTARNGRVVRHLLAECPDCREHLRQIGWPEERLERLLHISASENSLSPVTTASYDTAFGRAEKSLDAFFAPVWPLEEAPELLLASLNRWLHWSRSDSPGTIRGSPCPKWCIFSLTVAMPFAIRLRRPCCIFPT